MQCHQTGSIPVGITFNPLMPWDGVFQYAANDDKFWDKEVRRPATAFLARGKIPPQISATQGTMDAIGNVEEGAELSVRPRGSVVDALQRSGKIQVPYGQGQSKHARQKRKLQEELEESKAKRWKGSDQDSGGWGNRSSSSIQ